jgi:LemA protein
MNTRVLLFPNTLFAKSLGFGERDFFEVEDPSAIAAAPRVQF